VLDRHTESQRANTTQVRDSALELLDDQVGAGVVAGVDVRKRSLVIAVPRPVNPLQIGVVRNAVLTS